MNSTGMFQIESCEKQQKLCKVKIFKLQSMPKWTGCIDKWLVFKNSGIQCMVLIFNLIQEQQPCTHKIGSRLHDMTTYIHWQFCLQF